MAKRDHNPITLSDCKGLYTRNDGPAPPEGYLSRAINVVYEPAISEEPTNFGWIRARETFSEFGSTLPAVPIRFYIYTKASGNRIILLDASGNFWDAVSGINILTIANCPDFHGITLNDHFYFTPHDRITGLDGEFVYVYDPDLSATARKAAGAPMTGTFTVAVSSVNGNIEPGIHVMAISYETNTGYRSKPSLFVSFTAPTPTKKVNATVVPLGPANTVKRFIWMSQTAITYDGNAEAVPVYLVHTIDNNTTTEVLDTIDGFDTDLFDSADGYLDLLAEIPAGTFLSILDGRLVICGPKANPLVMRISNENDPESIDSIDGVKEVAKGDGGGVNTTRISRGNILFWKSYRTGIIRPNGDVPHNWPVEIIDGAMGAEVYGVSEVLNNYGPFYDVYLVANQVGLHVFNGAAYVNPLKPLSYVITPDWQRTCTSENIDLIRVLVDSSTYRIYIITVLNGKYIWMLCDFADGLTWDGVKWSTWEFNYPASLSKNYIDAHVIIDPDIYYGSSVILAIVEGSDKLRVAITNTISTGIDSDGNITSLFAIKLVDPELRIFHVNNVTLHAGSSIGNNIGACYVEIVGFTKEQFDPEPINEPVTRWFDAQGTRLEALVSAVGCDLSVSKFIVFIKVIFDETSYS